MDGGLPRCDTELDHIYDHHSSNNTLDGSYLLWWKETTDNGGAQHQFSCITIAAGDKGEGRHPHKRQEMTRDRGPKTNKQQTKKDSSELSVCSKLRREVS